MFCPKCKCEYIEGITECPDCRETLVESLMDTEYGSSAGQEDSPAGESAPEEEEASSGEESPAEEAIRQAEETDPEGEVPSEEETEEPKKPFRGDHRTLEEKAVDLKNSGYTLLFVGAAGAVCLILIFAGVIPMLMTGIMRILSLIVMGTLFAVFIFFGITSLMKAGSVSADAGRENEKREEILGWFLGAYDAESIDNAVNPDSDDNDLYFDRAAFIRSRIGERYMELDDALLDDLIEKIYTRLFEG